MDIYKIEDKKIAIKYGRFKNKVNEKHIDSYGELSAKNILNNSTKILKQLFMQKYDQKISNNSLLVGKVQSGKTSNLEMITALAFDNNINLVVIYGGYDNNLVDQCVERFEETFEIDHSDDDSPYLFSTQSDLSFINNSFFEEAIEDERPIILVSLKRPKALMKLNECLKQIDKQKINAIIIDDEGDQASLDTNKHSKEEVSATYSEIITTKNRLNDPIYLSVTATPQANIFQPELSAIMPNSLHLIPPANSYDGAEVFHLVDDNIVIIPDNDKIQLDELYMTSSLKDAINYFILASTIMFLRGIKYSDMIVHSHKEKIGHKAICEIINDYTDNIIMSINEGNDEDLRISFNEIRSIYNEKYFTKNIISTYPWNDDLEKNIKRIIRNIHVIEQNSDNGFDKKTLDAFKHKIYVGGDLLQRGITFKHLVTTYFTRWAKAGNMDTNLQRARWFGYRSKYLDLCKVFTTNTIKCEFSNLATIENDLWSQFEMVTRGELEIQDIIIDGNNTSLNPTRKNVADYKKVKFSKSWNNQRTGVFDQNIIEQNNNLLKQLISEFEKNDTSVGRTDGKTSAHYLIIPENRFKKFIIDTMVIFDNHPFNKEDILMNINSDVCLVLMNTPDSDAERKRTFKNGIVSALQQGADTTDESKRKYLGDAHVIVKKDIPNVQVFNILPKNGDGNDELMPEYKQYMYSLHFPVVKNVFKKK